VLAEVGSAEELLEAVDAHEPDVAIVDIRMPPTLTDEGVRAAHEIRTRHPGIGIVILSQHVDLATATRVLAEGPQRLGYLLKDRVSDPDEFAGALRDRIGAIGHSNGGATAADLMLVDRRVRAGVNMDGAIYGPVIERGLDRPFGIMMGDALASYCSQVREFRSRLRGPRRSWTTRASCTRASPTTSGSCRNSGSIPSRPRSAPSTRAPRCSSRTPG
jgi:CheY-like chemotaxis protein